jgi:apolipoprotein D and lipocalin family protein
MSARTQWIAMSVLLIATLALGTAAPAAATPASAPLPNAPVAALDLDRYAGRWHEIAHLPMFFQRQCVGDITATYTRLPDGQVEVRNACRTKDGDRDESVGAARPVPGTPGALKVRFAPGWLGWVPGIWADYWVVELDPAYRWAVVGGPKRKYLWVLSRDPAMSQATFDGIRARAARRGYPVQDLVMAATLVPDAPAAPAK